MPSWLEKFPKVELHVHLEGTVPNSSLYEIAINNKSIPRTESLAVFAKRFQFSTFDEFIQVWLMKCSVLRSYNDIRVAARAAVRHLADQNVLYAEMYFAPSPFLARGFKLKPLLDAILAEFSDCPGIEMRLLIDFVRRLGPGVAEEVLDRLIEFSYPSIAGIGIGGTELDFPPEPFARVFSKARDAGFGLTAHAGETAGPESIWGALKSLDVGRIGHGIAAIQDPGLVEHLARKAIPLEICLSSNLRTGVVASLSDHPIKKLYAAGVPMTINSDDPAMFATTITRELRLACDLLDLEAPHLAKFMGAAVDSSFAEPALKQSLHRAIEDAQRANLAST